MNFDAGRRIGYFFLNQNVCILTSIENTSKLFVKWPKWAIFNGIGHFDHRNDHMAIDSIHVVKFRLFWHIHNKHIMSFKMICYMAYIYLNFTETISKPIGRFLLGLISRSCDSKSRKERNNGMRYLISNI